MPENSDPDGALLKTLATCETRVWDGLVSGDAAIDATVLDDRFLGVYAVGFADKAAHIAQLQHGPTIVSYVLSRLRVMVLGENHAVLSLSLIHI